MSIRFTRMHFYIRFLLRKIVAEIILKNYEAAAKLNILKRGC